MGKSILGASGLGPKKSESPAPLEATGHTGHTDPIPAPPPPPELRESKPDASSSVPPPPQQPEVIRPTAPPELPRKRRVARMETKPQTIYFAEEDLELAADLAHNFKKSGRFKGLVKGHVGVSLVIRTALDLLNDEYRQDATAALDRGVRVASRNPR